MKKKIIILIVLAIISIIGINDLIFWMFTEQYNAKGISHWLIVTIDENQSKEYVGNLEGYDVYVEGLKIDELNFRTVDAENVPIKEAIDKELVSIEDWRRYAWKIRKNDGIEILQNENYEIAISSNECIIRRLQ